VSILEIALVSVLVALTGGAVLVAYRSKDKTLFWNPLTMFAGTFTYYFIIGPLLALGFGQTTMYGIDLRDVMWKPWLAGAVGLASIYVGFSIRIKIPKKRLVEGMTPAVKAVLKRSFILLFGLGLVGFAYDAYVSGLPITTMLMPVHRGLADDVSAVEREGFAAGNYLLLLIDAFIPALCVLCAATVELPLIYRLLAVGIPALQVELFYASWGYRHRIITLLVSLAATTFLLRGKRPSPGLILVGVSVMLLIAGTIVFTRSYGAGLDIRQLSGMKFSQVFLGGFNDSGTFFTTALVMDSFPTTFHFVGLAPVWIALTIPIPRRIWPSKPMPEFLDQLAYLTGTQGQACPVVGEHYMMAGWPGIVIGGLIIGIIYRRFWDFYRSNPRNPMVIAVYAVSWALCFPVINRGYLAQTLMEFFFTLLPLALLYIFSRAALTLRARSAPLVPFNP
jgi:O-antigen polysaccharide polymerase Wzy